MMDDGVKELGADVAVKDVAMLLAENLRRADADA
jgi:hypothetical protein